MKATGLVRRVDDLGRIVIPKEIRKQLGIKESNLMEFYMDSDNKGLYLQKYEVNLEEHLECFDEMVMNYGDRNPEQLNKIHEHIEVIKQLLKEDDEE